MDAQISLTVIKSPQPGKAVAFYKLLGLEFDYHQHGIGPFHYSCEQKGHTFEIYPLPPNIKEADTTTRLGFKVKDLDNLVDTLKREGYEVVAIPSETEWGYRAVVKDGEGRRVELIQS